MEFRFVELRPEHNETDLAVIEVYVAGALGAPHNFFGTH